MEFLFNELSLHGQFTSVGEAQRQLRILLGWRDRIRREGLVLRVARPLLGRFFTQTNTVRDVINNCTEKGLRLAAVAWLAKEGPFWDEEPTHNPDDFVECNGDVVTGYGIAEAALAVARGHEREAISSAPSEWERSPLQVEWIRSDSDREAITLSNAWHDELIEHRCKAAQREPCSWDELRRWAIRSCPNLMFSEDVVLPLQRSPFAAGAAKRFKELLSTLDRIKTSFARDGGLTEEGMRLYQNHFVGQKAWFTDSSDAEKIEFKNELTFAHPEQTGGKLFCSWHGKVKTPQMRIHFSYPITSSDPLYVVYMGPKITKR